MRKGLFGVLLVLLLIILILPLVMGLFAKRQFNEIVSTIRETQGIEIKIEKYQFRWFASKAYLNVSIAGLQEFGIDMGDHQEGEVDQLNLIADIYHGPIIFSDDAVLVGQNYTKIYRDDSSDQRLQNINRINEQNEDKNKKVPLASIFVYLNGHLHTQINLPLTTFIWDLADGKIISQALKGDWFLSADQNSIKANMTIDQVKLDFPGYHLQSLMEPITMEYEIYNEEKKQYKNKIVMKSPVINMSYDNTQLKIENFHLILKPSFENNLLSSSLSLDLERILKNGQDYGSMDTSASIKHIDAQYLLALSQGIVSLNQPDLSQQQRQLIILNMLTNLPELFSHRVEFEIDHFNFTMPAGNIKAQFYLQLPDSQDILLFDFISLTGESEVLRPKFRKS